MKKIIVLITILVLSACSMDGDSGGQVITLLPIDESVTPSNFTYRTTDTIKVKYSLPSGCHMFYNLYYQYKDTTRIVAIRSLQDLSLTCSDALIEKELEIPIQVTQKQDYVFKFWKGKDADGKDTFEEKVVPVIN
ncbi:hypothetical protein [Tenacibaculum sp. 190524A02b]|uniref:hypothetical protein n=1 Tax=Tenacibaculum vairaonense TaxID=3137860 RepID=UPI0031FABA9D